MCNERSAGVTARFDLERFIEECHVALASDASQQHVRELVARAVAFPASVLAALGEPQRAELGVLHRSPRLTILNVTLAPNMTIIPHDHRMWSVIGIYTGREDNIFWRRAPAGAPRALLAFGAQALGERDAEPLAHDVIHSVVNPLGRFTGAIHIYGGDFFGATRSEWDPETLCERPFEAQRAMERFAAFNRPA
jgi:predicted metal-dependent enzyme (double-stranded beta helix superfamily)